MSGLRMGAHAEYVTVPVSALVRKPVEVQHATQILNELRAANVLVKDPAGAQRGPAIRWLPAEPGRAKSK